MLQRFFTTFRMEVLNRFLHFGRDDLAEFRVVNLGFRMENMVGYVILYVYYMDFTI